MNQKPGMGEAEANAWPPEAIDTETLSPMDSAEGGIPHGIRSLRHRNYLWFWSGNFLSNIGTWMQSVAVGWLVMQLATSKPAFWLGVVGFASSIPVLAFSLLGGVIADRINRRKLLLVTQSAMMVFAFILWGLTALHWMNIPLLVLLSLATGVAMALTMPSYQALVQQLVPREDLANAIALNAAQFNMSRVVGPMLGGFAMAWIGVQGNFLLNALSFVAVLVALTRIHYPRVAPSGKASMWEDLKGGLHYVVAYREMFTLILMIAVASFLVVPYINFVAFFAKEVLHLGARGFGLLMAANGAGAFAGAVTMAMARHGRRRGRIAFRASLTFFVFVSLFALSRKAWLSALMLLGVGFFMVLMVATTHVMLQHMADDKMRGRVMSILATTTVGLTPVGSLLVGLLAGRFTAPLTIAGMAAVAAVTNITIYLMRPELRRME